MDRIIGATMIENEKNNWSVTVQIGRKQDIYHSLIITREGLILTLPIYLTLQGWIWCPSLPAGEYWPILSLGIRFSNTLPAENWAPILARWTWGKQFNAGEASHNVSFCRQAKVGTLVSAQLFLTKTIHKCPSNHVWKNIWGFIDTSMWHLCLQKCKILAGNLQM